MQIHWFRLLLLVLSTAVSPALGGDLTHGIEPHVPSRKIPSFYLILVVSPEKLSPAPYTNETPPTGIFNVHKRIRGYLKDERIAAQWYRKPQENDVIPWSVDMPEKWRRFHWLRPGTPKWNNIAIPAPKINEKIIVFAQIAPSRERSAEHGALKEEPNLTLLRIRGVFAYSEENISTLNQYMGRTDWPAFIMLPLWFIVLALSVSASIFFAISFNK